MYYIKKFPKRNLLGSNSLFGLSWADNFLYRYEFKVCQPVTGVYDSAGLRYVLRKKTKY